MRLTIDPSPPLSLFRGELEIVILISKDRIPEVICAEDLPKPDRHLLLGLMQTIAMAIGEQDPETVVLMEDCSLRLDRDGESRDVTAGLVVVKSREGRFGTLVVGDSSIARSLARAAVRWFMGTVRLDVP